MKLQLSEAAPRRRAAAIHPIPIAGRRRTATTNNGTADQTTRALSPQPAEAGRHRPTLSPTRKSTASPSITTTYCSPGTGHRIQFLAEKLHRHQRTTATLFVPKSNRVHTASTWVSTFTCLPCSPLPTFFLFCSRHVHLFFFLSFLADPWAGTC